VPCLTAFVCSSRFFFHSVTSPLVGIRFSASSFPSFSQCLVPTLDSLPLSHLLLDRSSCLVFYFRTTVVSSSLFSVCYTSFDFFFSYAAEWLPSQSLLHCFFLSLFVLCTLLHFHVRLVLLHCVCTDTFPFSFFVLTHTLTDLFSHSPTSGVVRSVFPNQPNSSSLLIFCSRFRFTSYTGFPSIFFFFFVRSSSCLILSHIAHTHDFI